MQLRDRLESPASTAWSQPPRPWVLLVDDGELDDLREIAHSLGASTGRHAEDMLAVGWRQPQRLLVVSDRRAPTLGRPVAQEQDRFATMAVLSACPPQLRERIHGMGFDLVVERPVDHASLRTLLRDALYRGAGRPVRRVPVGYPVTLHTGVRRRDAQLLALDEGGCTLRVGSPVTGVRRVAVELPPPLGGGQRLRIEGSVVRECSLAGRAVLVSVVFHLTETVRRRLDALRGATGPVDS